jgi:hypothetical protein
MRADFAIVNRAFWPESPVIGEALLKLAETAAKSNQVCVITQSKKNLKTELNDARRGYEINIKSCHSYSNVNSKIPTRIFDGFVFMLWTLYSLILTHPKKIYISTNPPIFIPFIIFLYCFIFRAEYYYHLQDIHPEAANIIIPLNKLVFNFLSWLDSTVMRNATGIMTLTEEMKEYIQLRSKTTAPILLIDNPAFIEEDELKIVKKTKDIVFCGTAGRLQLVPLILNSITEYLNNGGTLNFTFIGSGVYLSKIKLMSQQFQAVSCLGFLPSQEAADIVSQHRWGLLPINDAVTRFAFPSRSSSYIISNCNVLAVCSDNTSVAKWVTNNKFGIVSKPDINSLILHFKSIENLKTNDVSIKDKTNLSTSYFVEKMLKFIKI